MDLPLFSQIPNAVLNHFGSNEFGSKKKKRNKSNKSQDEPDSSDFLRPVTPKPVEHKDDINTVESLKSLSKIPLNQVESVDQVWQVKQIPQAEVSPTGDSPKEPPHLEIASRHKNTSDAIVQVDATPKMKTVACQTDDSLLPIPPEELYEIYKNQIQVLSLRANPNLSLKMHTGPEPPLKLGLTKPKGRQRRVYYPGED